VAGSPFHADQSRRTYNPSRSPLRACSSRHFEVTIGGYPAAFNSARITIHPCLEIVPHVVLR